MARPPACGLAQQLTRLMVKLKLCGPIDASLLGDASRGPHRQLLIAKICK